MLLSALLDCFDSCVNHGCLYGIAVDGFLNQGNYLSEIPIAL